MQRGGGTSQRTIDEEQEDLSSDIHSLRMVLGYHHQSNANEEDDEYVYTFTGMFQLKKVYIFKFLFKKELCHQMILW